MELFRKKILILSVSSVALPVVGIFCFSQNADAFSQKKVEFSSSSMVHDKPENGAARRKMPADNSVKPCCVDSHSGAPLAQNPIFIGSVKFMPIGFTERIDNGFLPFSYKTVEFSSASPPDLSILSSIFKLE